MARKNLKMRVDGGGRLEIVDPGYDTLELMRFMDPGFEIKTAPLPLFSTPRFLKVKEMGCGLSIKELQTLSDEQLWNLNDNLFGSHLTEPKPRHLDEASFLNLKIELAYRLLKSCRLCGRKCGVNRTSGSKGVCGLGMDATVFEHFVHIAEEPPVNRSLDVFLAGCGLQCFACQQAHLLDPSSICGDKLDASFWKKLNIKRARALSFIGGNPDESLYAILRFLSNAPRQWALPIVWNCHGYATQETLKLLNGLIDIYVADYKYGNSVCGENLAGAPGYSETAYAAIEAMLGQDVPVIVRILIQPGHVECCHIPILERMRAIAKSGYLIVSLRDQYCPEGLIKEKNDHPMNKRTAADEVNKVREFAQKQNLNIIS